MTFFSEKYYKFKIPKKYFQKVRVKSSISTPKICPVCGKKTNLKSFKLSRIDSHFRIYLCDDHFPSDSEPKLKFGKLIFPPLTYLIFLLFIYITLSLINIYFSIDLILIFYNIIIPISIFILVILIGYPTYHYIKNALYLSKRGTLGSHIQLENSGEYSILKIKQQNWAVKFYDLNADLIENMSDDDKIQKLKKKINQLGSHFLYFSIIYSILFVLIVLIITIFLPSDLISIARFWILMIYLACIGYFVIRVSYYGIKIFMLKS